MLSILGLNTRYHLDKDLNDQAPVATVPAKPETDANKPDQQSAAAVTRSHEPNVTQPDHLHPATVTTNDLPSEIPSFANTSSASTLEIDSRFQPSSQPDLALLKPPFSDTIKLTVIENLPLVDQTYAFPTTEIPEKRSKTGVSLRKCSYNLLQKHKFLGYSQKADGVYCVPCMFWNELPKSGTVAELFITAPLKDWKHLSDKATSQPC